VSWRVNASLRHGSASQRTGIGRFGAQEPGEDDGWQLRLQRRVVRIFLRLSLCPSPPPYPQQQHAGHEGALQVRCRDLSLPAKMTEMYSGFSVCTVSKFQTWSS
jgi:hypothetical protein